jgi:hypothetical protein
MVRRVDMAYHTAKWSGAAKWVSISMANKYLAHIIDSWLAG